MHANTLLSSVVLVISCFVCIQGLNVSLCWQNTDPRKFVNVVPTSAVTGEGIPDLLQLMVKLTQTWMNERLMYVDYTECTVLEVRHTHTHTHTRTHIY